MNAFYKLKSINLRPYDDRELHLLLKLTVAHNQEVVARAMAQKIDTYNGWHFKGLFEICTPQSSAVLLQALAQTISQKIKVYDAITIAILEEIARKFPEQANAQQILKVIQQARRS